MIVLALIATIVIAVFLIALTQPVKAYDVQVSGLPSSVPLDKETTIVVTIAMQGAQSVPIEKVELVLLNSSKGIIVNGTFEANGTIIDDGGFILSVGVTNGVINHGWGYDSTTGIVYSVKIILKSTEFKASKGNELDVIVDRGNGLSPLHSSAMMFDIGGEIPWLMIIVAIVVIDAIIVVSVWYYLRNRRK
jgi:hypothetical protein